VLCREAQLDADDCVNTIPGNELTNIPSVVQCNKLSLKLLRAIFKFLLNKVQQTNN